MVLEDNIIVLDLVCVLHNIGHAGATRGFYTKAQTHALAALFKKRFYALCRGNCQCDRHVFTCAC
jgi:hypothetical protein